MKTQKISGGVAARKVEIPADIRMELSSIPPGHHTFTPLMDAVILEYFGKTTTKALTEVLQRKCGYPGKESAVRHRHYVLTRGEA